MNCANLLDLRNLHEQVKKSFCYQKLFWLFTVWLNCSSDLKNCANSQPSASNFKSFSWSLEQFSQKVRTISVTKYYFLSQNVQVGHKTRLFLVRRKLFLKRSHQNADHGSTHWRRSSNYDHARLLFRACLQLEFHMLT